MFELHWSPTQSSRYSSLTLVCKNVFLDDKKKSSFLYGKWITKESQWFNKWLSSFIYKIFNDLKETFRLFFFFLSSNTFELWDIHQQWYLEFELTMNVKVQICLLHSVHFPSMSLTYVNLSIFWLILTFCNSQFWQQIANES